MRGDRSQESEDYPEKLMQANTNIPHAMVPAGMHGVEKQKRIHATVPNNAPARKNNYL